MGEKYHIKFCHITIKLRVGDFKINYSQKGFKSASMVGNTFEWNISKKDQRLKKDFSFPKKVIPSSWFKKLLAKILTWS